MLVIAVPVGILLSRRSRATGPGARCWPSAASARRCRPSACCCCWRSCSASGPLTAIVGLTLAALLPGPAQHRGRAPAGRPVADRGGARHGHDVPSDPVPRRGPPGRAGHRRGPAGGARAQRRYRDPGQLHRRGRARRASSQQALRRTASTSCSWPAGSSPRWPCSSTGSPAWPSGRRRPGPASGPAPMDSPGRPPRTRGPATPEEKEIDCAVEFPAASRSGRRPDGGRRAVTLAATALLAAGCGGLSGSRCARSAQGGSLAASGINLAGQTYTVGGKEFDEQLVLCNMQSRPSSRWARSANDRCNIPGPRRPAPRWSAGRSTCTGRTRAPAGSPTSRDASRSRSRRRSTSRSATPTWRRTRSSGPPPTPFNNTYAHRDDPGRSRSRTTCARPPTGRNFINCGNPDATLCVEAEFAGRDDGLAGLLPDLRRHQPAVRPARSEHPGHRGHLPGHGQRQPVQLR